MKIVFDTNIILDVLLDRKPHVEMSARLFDAIGNGDIEGYLGATTITTIDYLVSKFHNKQQARQAINQLLELFSIAEVNKDVLIKAVNSDFVDFEDAVLYQAGLQINADGLVTRNEKDFKSSLLPVYNPNQLLTLIQFNRLRDSPIGTSLK